MYFFKEIFRPDAVITGLKVALVVGVILNLINQGEVLLSGSLLQLNWTKFALTFFVPFGVSVYSAWQTKKRFDTLLSHHDLPDSATLARQSRNA